MAAMRYEKGISFCVVRGEIFGILGINGDRKTTTLERMEGFGKYNSGTVKAHGKIGILPSIIEKNTFRIA